MLRTQAQLFISGFQPLFFVCFPWFFLYTPKSWGLIFCFQSKIHPLRWRSWLVLTGACFIETTVESYPSILYHHRHPWKALAVAREKWGGSESRFLEGRRGLKQHEVFQVFLTFHGVNTGLQRYECHLSLVHDLIQASEVQIANRSDGKHPFVLATWKVFQLLPQERVSHTIPNRKSLHNPSVMLKNFGKEMCLTR